MTDEQIFELASQYLHYDVDGDRANEWRGEHYELLKFALTMYNKGICEGAYQQSKRYMEGVFDDD